MRSVIDMSTRPSFVLMMNAHACTMHVEVETLRMRMEAHGCTSSSPVGSRASIMHVWHEAFDQRSMCAREIHHDCEMIGPGGHAIPRVSVQHALYASVMRVIYGA